MRVYELVIALREIDPNLEVQFLTDEYGFEDIEKVEVRKLPGGCRCCPPVDTAIIS